MNWYKKAQVLEYPDRYTDIGHYFWSDRDHPREIKEIVWMIDNRYQLHTKEQPHNDKSHRTHMDIFGIDIYDRSVAAGRAVLAPNRRISSARFVDWKIMNGLIKSDPMAIKKKEYIKRRVEPMLFKAFSLDEVYFFDDYN